MANYYHISYEDSKRKCTFLTKVQLIVHFRLSQRFYEKYNYKILVICLSD